MDAGGIHRRIHANTHTHTHTHTHTRTHTYVHTYSNASHIHAHHPTQHTHTRRIQCNTHTHTHTRTHAHMHTRTHAHTHTCTHAHTFQSNLAAVNPAQRDRFICVGLLCHMSKSLLVICVGPFLNQSHETLLHAHLTYVYVSRVICVHRYLLSYVYVSCVICVRLLCHQCRSMSIYVYGVALVSRID